MRKIILLFLIFMLGTVLIACAGEEPPGEELTEPTFEITTSNPPPPPQQTQPARTGPPPIETEHMLPEPFTGAIHN